MALELLPWLACAVALAGGPALAQKEPHTLPTRSAIVHLFEWKFSDIASECEQVLAPLGYAAVQTSPITDHLSLPEKNHPWWERYQPMSYKIISRSGTEEDFRKMVKKCNDAGVRVYVDVVFNHMTGQVKHAKSIGGRTGDGIIKNYPDVPYNYSAFNPPCDIVSYNDVNQVRNCMLNGLNDLNQGSNFVRAKIINFLNHLIDLGVAGFRVDAAKHMWPEDLQYIFNEVKNLSTEHGFAPRLRPFIYQEVIDLGNEGVKVTEYNSIGRVTEFKYGAELGKAFHGRNPLKRLVNFGTEWGFLPSGDAVVFIDNHDNQRGHGAGGSDILSHKSPPALYKMALAFMLSWPYGLPRVMSSYSFSSTDEGPPSHPNGTIKDVTSTSDGQCGNGWVCEHRRPAVANMVAFRTAVGDAPVNNWWDNGNYQIAYSRGKKGFLIFNGELHADLNETLQTGLPEGTYCDLITGKKEANQCTGKTVVVNRDGKAHFSLQVRDTDGFLRAIHLQNGTTAQI